MSSDWRPTIGVTMGDPAGIGPEVIVKALADPALREQADFVIYGMNELLTYAADQAEIEPYWWRVPYDAPHELIAYQARTASEPTGRAVVIDYDQYSMLARMLARPTSEGGMASLHFVKDAISDAMRSTEAPKRLDAIVTGPISKTSWQLSGERRYPGHTELLAKQTKAKREAMMFVSPKLRVVLTTIHLPLMDIQNVLTVGKIYDAIDLGHQACCDLGIAEPRIAVCGLNPHASEDGLFGDEESRLIEPAIQLAQSHGIKVEGPFPADTLFWQAVNGQWDLVVAMYHDQGLIPVKLLGFDQAVNVTLGLPIIRTSVDHGTAFDLAGRNQANAGSMIEALRLAVTMSRGRPK